MSERFIPMDEDKAEVEHLKPTMNAALISKILAGNKKKKPPAKRAPKVLLPPCISYVSNSKSTYLKVPLTYNMTRIFAKPKINDIKLCACGNKGKYREPKTLIPYCSIPCFKNLRSHN